MSYESRPNSKNRYSYKKRRVDGHVVSEYLGSGEIAAALAAIYALEHAAAQEKRDALRAEQAKFDELEKQLAEMDRTVNTIVTAHMLVNGYHKHKGQWRKTRVIGPKSKRFVQPQSQNTTTGPTLATSTNAPNPPRGFTPSQLSEAPSSSATSAGVALAADSETKPCATPSHPPRSSPTRPDRCRVTPFSRRDVFYRQTLGVSDSRQIANHLTFRPAQSPAFAPRPRRTHPLQSGSPPHSFIRSQRLLRPRPLLRFVDTDHPRHMCYTLPTSRSHQLSPSTTRPPTNNARRRCNQRPINQQPITTYA